MFQENIAKKTYLLQGRFVAPMEMACITERSLWINLLIIVIFWENIGTEENFTAQMKHFGVNDRTSLWIVNWRASHYNMW